MELKDFVSASMVQIVQGYKEARKKLNEDAVWTSKGDPNENVIGYKKINSSQYNPIFAMNFEVFIEASEESGSSGSASGNIKLNVSSGKLISALTGGAKSEVDGQVDGEGNISKGRSSGTSQRITFSLPYTL